MAVITDVDSHVIDGALDVVASFTPGMRCIVLPSPGLHQGGRPAFERPLCFAESLTSHLTVSVPELVRGLFPSWP